MSEASGRSRPADVENRILQQLSELLDNRQ